ncbi:unnamed protein product [Ranitomeya imitator]|uniref:m7GpppN-mRNA hydrolase NUDT17 n=1 Tax=Ranitomeya imitator TaxID=111125 RepID=A0ABN9KXY8_9NEOB|nr:unnamed protein product [Ranitomeya imitator]
MCSAADIFELAEPNLLSLTALHIRGVENLEADFLSCHTLRQGEWTLNPRIFRKIVDIWGLPQIDLFATRNNRQMECVKRILVHLRKEESLLQCAKFVQGVTGHFAPCGQDRATVNCGLDHNRFIISDRPFSGSRKAKLQRPSFCPIKNLTAEQAASLPEEIVSRGVDVGVTILVQSVNKRVLLTRRTKELHIFPNIWVPPGLYRHCKSDRIQSCLHCALYSSHIQSCIHKYFQLFTGGHMENGEQLHEAGLRELQEETGLNLQSTDLLWSILGLWESAFPPLLSHGLPQRHHIVAYLLVSSNETHHELQEKLRPDEQEVSACAWIDPELAKMIVAAEEGVKDSGRENPELQTSVRITEVCGRSLTQRDLAVSTLLNTAPIDGEDTERVSTGTKYALGLWLEALRQEEVT